MNGVPRAAISAITGARTCVYVSSTMSSGAHGSGEYAPIPPVFAPKSPSSARLKSCAGCIATMFLPSEIPNRDISGPFKNSSITTRVHESACANAASRSDVTTTPLPAASPSSFTT
ncbi:unannotated protein [freshwater metagenome]|uniref:Unannotated protein n=1 Tax=freshwater metagenome TaxID=449393 RepID=A0A6J6IYA3_9ZZZZ